MGALKSSAFNLTKELNNYNSLYGNTLLNWQTLNNTMQLVNAMQQDLVTINNAIVPSLGAFTQASGTNTYTNDTQLSITSYSIGQSINVLFKNSNTGASTININSLGAIPLKKNVTSDLQNGDIIAGGIYLLQFDGTNFQITINTSL